MRILHYPILFLLLSSTCCLAQMSGNAVMGRERQGQMRSSGVLFVNDSTMLIEAQVMMNVAADEYTATFGVSQDAATVDEANRKINARVDRFISSLRSIPVGDKDIFVDFVTQNRVYEFEAGSTVAREKFTGFRVKKNVIVRFKESRHLERMLLAAAGAEIYDLVKVDYHVENPAAIRDRLLEEGARIIKEKQGRYTRLFNIPIAGPSQIQEERYDIFFPPDLYLQYTAAETGRVNSGYGTERYVIQEAEKSSTYYFNGLNINGFDMVINPSHVEPPVQFTLMLKLRYPVARR